MSQKRTDILRKISALLDRTTERGCTEAEAMEAASKASELMTAHDVELGEMGFRTATCIKRGCTVERWGNTALVDMLAPAAIAALCDCRVWRNGNEVVFFGFQSDVDVAVHLHGTLSGATQRAIRFYKTTADYHLAKSAGHNGRTLISSFIKGMESRLAQRLWDMARAKKQEMQATGSGTSLVIVKTARVDDEFANIGLRFRRATKRIRAKSYGAFTAGQEAGDRVAINPALHA